MANCIALGLTKRRARLAGKLELKHQELNGLTRYLEAVDATLAQFVPRFNAETIKAKAFRLPNDWSNRATIHRIKPQAMPICGWRPTRG